MGFEMKVGDCMTKGVITLSEDKTALEAAKLLAKKNIGSIIITSKGDAVGILTERDIIHKIVAKELDPSKQKLSQIMSKPLKAVEASQTIEEAALAMRKHGIKRLPVLEKGNLVGIISEGDLISVYPGIIGIISESPHMK
ncbi:MAG: CBS domain-containing protein [Candidatus Micrarchaeota archaeon]